MMIILKLCLLGRTKLSLPDVLYRETYSWMNVGTEAAFALLYVCAHSKEKNLN